MGQFVGFSGLLPEEVYTLLLGAHQRGVGASSCRVEGRIQCTDMVTGLDDDDIMEAGWVQGVHGTQGTSGVMG